MVPHLYVFRFGVEDRVFGYTYGTGAVTEKWNLGALLTKITHDVGHQSSWEQQLAPATYSVCVVDWATMDCLRDDQETKEEPRNWQHPEVYL